MKKTIHILSRSIQSIMRFLTVKERKTYLTSAVLMFVNSLLELLTLSLMIPFFGVVISSSPLTRFSAVRRLVPFTGTESSTDALYFIGGFLLIMFVVKNIVSYLLYAYYNSYVYTVATALSKRKLDAYFNASFIDFQEANTAERLRETSFIPVEFAHHIILGSMIILSEGMIVLLFTVGIAVYRPSMLVVMLAAFVPFILIARYGSSRILRKTKEAIRNLSPMSLTKLSDALAGYTEIKLYGKEEHFKKRYLADQEELNTHLGTLNTVTAVPARLAEIFSVAGIVAVVFFAAGSDAQRQLSVLTSLTIFLAFAYRIIPTINKILNASAQMQTYSFTIDLLPEPVTVVENPNDEFAAQDPIRFRTAIELRNITFSYPQKKVPVLHDLSLSIPKGGCIGIMGRSGDGKTTLVRILLGVLHQQSGAITIDGKPVNDTAKAPWHDLFAYVSQDSFLLSDTVEANIAFGIPRSEIDAEKIQRVLRRAGLQDVINGLPEGTRTMIGEQGKKLSSGQKQRMIIARALYRNAELFIFDEATSDLDRKTEREILQTIAQLIKEKKTVLMISHRRTALVLCDQVFSLQRKRLTPLSIKRRTRR